MIPMKSHPVPDSARDQAAHWYARLHSGTMAPAERAAFEAWKAQSLDHGRAWTEIEATHQDLARLAQRPEFLALRAEALQPAARRGAFRGQWKVAASLAFVVAGTATGYGLWRHKEAQPVAGQVAADQLFETALGETRTVTLADGSRLTLDTGSAVAVPRWNGERRVRLIRGQGFFQVAKDPDHPFVVDAGQGTVRAVGTAFAVRSLAQGFRVALTEGKVKVAIPSAGREDMLEPGQVLAYDGRSVTRAASGADRATRWLSGEITFENATLGEAIAEMNRYNARKIVLEGSDPGTARRLSGVFRVGDGETFVRALDAYGMARIVSQDAQEIRLRAVSSH